MNFFPPSITHLSVTGIPSRRGHRGRIRPLPLNVAPIHRETEAEEGRSKEENIAERKHEWGRAFAGEWERILSNQPESRARQNRM